MSQHSPSSPPSRSRLILILGGLALVLLTLVAPMLLAAFEAKAAKSDLERPGALEDGVYPTARGAVARGT